MKFVIYKEKYAIQWIVKNIIKSNLIFKTFLIVLKAKIYISKFIKFLKLNFSFYQFKIKFKFK